MCEYYNFYYCSTTSRGTWFVVRGLNGSDLQYVFNVPDFDKVDFCANGLSSVIPDQSTIQSDFLAFLNGKPLNDAEYAAAQANWNLFINHINYSGASTQPGCDLSLHDIS